MIKKALILLFSASLFAVENKNCTCNTVELSTPQIIAFYSLLGAGTIAAAPYVLPAGTIAAISAWLTYASSAAAIYLFPSTVTGKVGLGLAAAQWARPLVLQTTEEKVYQLLEEKASRATKAKTEFISCLKENKANSLRNPSGRPVTCEDAATFYAFNSSVSELQKRIDAFKNDKCFCY